MSRKLSDTKFKEIFNKPLFGQFGGMNTLRPKTFEGDYMGSHNVHCQQNNLSRKSVHFKTIHSEQSEEKEKVKERGVSKKIQFASIQESIRVSHPVTQSSARPVSHSNQWGIIKQEDKRIRYDNKHNLLAKKKQRERRSHAREEEDKKKELKSAQLKQQLA